MSAVASPPRSPLPRTTRGTQIGMSLVGASVVVVGWLGGIVSALVVALALLGTPLFAIMGGASEILPLDNIAREACTENANSGYRMSWFKNLPLRLKLY